GRARRVGVRALVRRRARPSGDVEGGERNPVNSALAFATPARRAAWTAAATSVVDLLLPRCCVVCERLLDRRENGMVCGRCWSRIAPLPSPRCDRCGHPTYSEKCRWCELLPPYVRAARSVCWAAGDVGLGVVHALKY